MASISSLVGGAIRLWMVSAYGAAGPVEALLERADTDDRALWDELWSRLCHQGTVQTASYAALPRLSELAALRDLSGYGEPFFLATCIVASTGGPEEPAAVRARYADTIRALHDMAERLVPLAADDTDFIYRAQAVLATERDSVWSTRLSALANQELEFACPGCDEQLLSSLETSPAHVKSFDDAPVGQTTVAPSDPGQLTGGEARTTNWQPPTSDRRLRTNCWTFRHLPVPRLPLHRA